MITMLQRGTLIGTPKRIAGLPAWLPSPKSDRATRCWMWELEPAC